MKNPYTLGFRIDSNEQIALDHSSGGLATREIGSFKQYLGAFYNIVLENLNRQSLDSSDWQRTVSVSDGGITPRVRRLPRVQQATLVRSGRHSTRDWLLNQHDQ